MGANPWSLDRQTGVTYAPQRKTPGAPPVPAGVADRYASPGYNQPYTPGSVTADRVPNPNAVALPLPAITTYGGGGGGGGASVTPGLDQNSFNSILTMLGAGRPQQYNHTPLDLPAYDAPDFYSFDSSPYDIAQQTVTDQIGAARTSGNQTYADARNEIGAAANPFGNVTTTNPNVQAAMARMMQANGVNPNIASGVTNEGIQADQAFSNVQALMSGNYDMRQQSNLRANTGDTRRFNESLGTEERLMGASVQMALAKAKSQYQRDLFAYGKEEADRNFEITMQEAIANNQGVNQANQTNTQATNSYNSSLWGPIIDLVLAGQNSQGVQGLDVSAIASLMAGR